MNPERTTAQTLISRAAQKPYLVFGISKAGKYRNKSCLVSGHDTEAEANWAAQRLTDIFGIETEVCVNA